MTRLAAAAQTQPTEPQSDGDLVSEIGTDLEVVVDRWDAGQIGLGDLVLVVIVVIVAAAVAWLVRRLLARAAARVDGPAATASLLAGQVVSIGIYLLASVIVLEVLGFSLGPVLILVLIAIVVVLFMQPLLWNLSAGLLLQLRSPFMPGDVVETGDILGVVDEVNARTVVVVTNDGRTAHVPNREVLEHRLVNYSTTGRRRSVLELELAAGVDVTSVTQQLERAVAGVAHILEDPPPDVLLTGFEGSNVCVEVRFWHEPQLAAERLARDGAARAVVELLDRSGLALADERILVDAPAARLRTGDQP